MRYSWVIFREVVLEWPMPKEKLVALNERTANEYVAAAMKLKAGTIKLGQFISARADIVPKELVTILSQLQDRVEAAPYDYVRQTIEGEFGEPIAKVFKSIEEKPLAAASFGQVHRAVTWQDDAVVVKVLHRNIERSLKVDLFIFRAAVFFFSRLFPRFMLDRVYDEIANVTWHELDYHREAKAAERVRNNLANDTRIRVPKVMWDYCRPRVLCLEDITGLRCDDRKLIEQTGGDPNFVLRAIIGAFCQQIYVDGFFQSDPHPGNLFYYPPDGNGGPVVGLIDFGQSKEMPPQLHHALRRAVTATIQRDPDMFLDAMVEMGVVEEVETDKVRDVVLKLGEQIKGGSAREIMSLDYEALARDVIKALQELDVLTLPNDLVMYGRTLGLLHGLTFTLDRDLPLFEVAAPYLMEFAFGQPRPSSAPKP